MINKIKDIIVPSFLKRKPVTPGDYAGMGTLLITQPFPEYLSGGAHTGIDFAAKTFNKLYSVTPARIAGIRKGTDKLTSYILLVTDDEYLIYYKHSKLLKGFDVGDRVKRGQAIGRVQKDNAHWGGYHCHMMTQLDGKNLDPVEFLLDREPFIKYKFTNKKVLEYYKNKPYYSKMIIV